MIALLPAGLGPATKSTFGQRVVEDEPRVVSVLVNGTQTGSSKNRVRTRSGSSKENSFNSVSGTIAVRAKSSRGSSHSK